MEPSKDGFASWYCAPLRGLRRTLKGVDRDCLGGREPQGPPYWKIRCRVSVSPAPGTAPRSPPPPLSDTLKEIEVSLTRNLFFFIRECCERD